MNINKLKKVIQKANPEIMELKFGCEVLLKNRDDIFVIGNEEIDEKNNEVLFGDGYIVGIPIIKIFGRSITFFDVLKTYCNKERDNANVCLDVLPTLAMQMDAENIVERYQKNALKIVGMWIQSKDNNLDNQSDECKQFLINSLVKK